MNETCQPDTRHTITVNHLAFLKLKNMGRFGESYSELILRLLAYFENVDVEERYRND